ncbi:MAG: hypothetical protein WD669_09700 [Pirellulales bacterium]
MVQIAVSDELARAIVEAGPNAVLVNSHGLPLAHLTPVEYSGPIGMTEEHYAELQRRMANDDGTRYTWAEVKAHLHSLAPE